MRFFKNLLLLGFFTLHAQAADTNYFLPDDSAAAQMAFLGAAGGLAKGDEIFMMAYSFTWLPLMDALAKDEAAGAKVHLLLDRSESSTPAEKKAIALLTPVLPITDLTLTTAGSPSKKPSEIFHWKAFVVLHKDGTATCWEGSVNFTASGWLEGNSARLFVDKDWAVMFVKYFAEHKAWALAHPAKND
jgi:hypothetical protein